MPQPVASAGVESFDLIIVGTGSGNGIPAAFDHWNIALVEKGVFGGTCLNRG
jgi:mycothione reductase